MPNETLTKGKAPFFFSALLCCKQGSCEGCVSDLTRTSSCLEGHAPFKAE